MKKLIKKVTGFMKNEEGQGLVEYALLLVLIAILAIAAIIMPLIVVLLLGMIWVLPGPRAKPFVDRWKSRLRI